MCVCVRACVCARAWPVLPVAVHHTALLPVAVHHTPPQVWHAGMWACRRGNLTSGLKLV